MPRSKTSLCSRLLGDETIALIGEMEKALVVHCMKEDVLSIDTSTNLEGVSLESLNCWHGDTTKKSTRIDI
jgi:hypothetical protein